MQTSVKVLVTGTEKEMNSRRAREGLTESFLTLLPTSLFTPVCIALRALPSHLLPWVNYPRFGLKPFPPFV